MRVYSFVSPSGTINSFSADVKLFFDYLTSNQNFPASTQNLIGKRPKFAKILLLFFRTANLYVVYQIGTEAFTGGPAKFTVSKFVADVKL